MNNRKTDDERSINTLRQRVKLSEYPEKMFQNGFFNPICPINYNFLTGLQEEMVTPSRPVSDYNITARINGTAVYKN